MSDCTQYKTKEECNSISDCKYTDGTKRKFCRKRRNTMRKSKKPTGIVDSSNKQKLKKQTKKTQKRRQSKPKQKMEPPKTPLNEKMANMLTELANGELALGRIFQSRAYKNAAEIIILMEPFYEITPEIQKQKGIGPKIYDKLKKFQETGTLSLLERIRANPRIQLNKIYGIGAKKADELVTKDKITSISQLRENQHLLNQKQRIGLEYYEDIETRIPREEIIQHERYMRRMLPENSGLIMEIVGSYRRGAKTSGDIDVIFTHQNESEGLRAFKEYISLLKESGYITHILAKGKKKSMFIAKLKDSKRHRRIDFLFAPKEQYPFTTLYFTGSKFFNIYMRRFALEKNISLSEQGMKDTKTKKFIPADNINTERDIFTFLGLKYIEPTKRRGRGDIQLLEAGN